MALQNPTITAMNNDRAATFQAFFILGHTLTRIPADVVRSLYEADKVRQTLNVIFTGQCENVNNNWSRPKTHRK